MGIVQENRLAPQPEVVETEYGAEYVKVATESEEPSVPVEEQPLSDKPKPGRPKKSNKKR